ncbi:hypothetical protein EUGRSUZ_D01372 [Eucalyptus grandis]|uniref:Uncharacterized protein n=2 Tax=Eucalyptus grandis TaxID=71139 RepID=A0ACC3L4F0_EUCGR|nr:hypothetical protein EUGRSUZ_D01372 [Eucalyptus grandis]
MDRRSCGGELCMRKEGLEATVMEAGLPPAEGPLVRRYSISAAAAASASASSPPSQLPLASKVQRLADNVQLARQDYLELRQEASELQEYSNTKLNRVTRYLGVLADKKPKLDQVALEGEARIAPLVCENRKLFTELLTSKE